MDRKFDEELIKFRQRLSKRWAEVRQGTVAMQRVIEAARSRQDVAETGRMERRRERVLKENRDLRDAAAELRWRAERLVGICRRPAYAADAAAASAAAARSAPAG
jgi:hypothetical protein